jgi:hypothetical protein
LPVRTIQGAKVAELQDYIPVIDEGMRQGAKLAVGKVGAAHVANVTTRESVRYASNVTATRAAGGIAASYGPRRAAELAATNIAAAQATAERLSKVAGPVAGVVVAPLVEMAALRLDGGQHSREEYAEAALVGVASGTASAVAGLAASAVAGALYGSVVPGIGTAVGIVAGIAAGIAGKSQMKEWLAD